MQIGGIVLCGGKSQRMGYPKALLPFGAELLLPRVIRIIGEVVRPVVVVAAENQPLPPLPPDVRVARDEQEARGPLQGLLAGLSALPAAVDAAYATSCDVPLLNGPFIRRMIERLDDYEIVVPTDDRFAHPLAAVYRVSVLPQIRRLLAEDRLRPAYLFEQVRTRRVPVEELRDVDPDLRALANLNHPADYAAAVAQAGLTIPASIREALGLDIEPA